MTAARRIFLTGMPACGKTTLGLAVTRLMPQWMLVDLDHEIEAAQGMTVAQIFASAGEERFRQLERETLRDICDRDADMIVCTGGGTPCCPGMSELMLGAGTVVWLDAPTDVLARRVMMQPGQRPLLEGKADLAAALDELRRERTPYYNKAHSVFDSSRLDTAAQIEDTARAFITRYMI